MLAAADPPETAGEAVARVKCSHCQRRGARTYDVILSDEDWSLLLFRRPEAFRDAFSLVPEYLQTEVGDVRNYNELGVQLGRRFQQVVDYRTCTDTKNDNNEGEREL